MAARGFAEIIRLEGMEESFINDCVVEVESGHPGFVNYKLIATPETWRLLAAQLASAAENSASVDESKKNDRGEISLLSKYATIYKGKSSRVSISFYAVKNLTAYHVRPTWLQKFKSNASCFLIILVVVGVLYLAGVGASRLLGDFIKAP